MNIYSGIFVGLTMGTAVVALSTSIVVNAREKSWSFLHPKRKALKRDLKQLVPEPRGAWTKRETERPGAPGPQPKLTSKPEKHPQSSSRRLDEAENIQK
jgi:hypothetical protein